MASFRKMNLYKSSISVVLVFLMLIYQFLPGFTALAADVAPDQVDRTDWLSPSVVPERKELVNIVNGDLTVYDHTAVSNGFAMSNASDANRKDGSFGWKTRPPKGYTVSKQRAYQIEYQMAGKMLNSGFAMTDYKGKNDNTAIYAELNANIPGTLYQEIASIPGETLYYGFYHSVRRNNATDQTIKYTYNTADGIDIYSETGDATDTTTTLNINKMNFYLSGKTKRDEFGTDGYPLNENANNFDENGTMRVRPCWSLRRSTQQSLADDTAQIKRGINYGWQQFLIYDAVAKKNVVHYGYLFDVWDTVKNTGVSYFKVPKTDINGNKWDSTTATEPTTGVNTRDTQAELSALKLAGYVQGSINNATFKESVIGYWDTSFGWKRYFGSYTVPKNQVLTEYAYESTTTKNQSYGNYLDGVYFMSGSSLGVEKTFSGRSRAVLPNSIIGAKIEVSNFGAMNATSIKVTDKLSPFTDYVDYIGNVKVMNTTKNTDITSASKINYDVVSGVLTVDLPTIRGVKERAENNEMDNGKPVQIGDTIDITFDLKALTEIRNTAFSTAGKYIKNQATVDFRDQDNPLKEEMSLSEMKKVASAVPQMYIIDVFLSKTAKEVTGQKPEYIETDANGNKNQFYEVNLNVLGKVGMYTNNIRLDNPPEWLIWDTLKQNPTVPANTPYVSITQNLTKRTGEAVDINNIRGDDILKMAVTLRNTGSAVATNVTLHELLSPFYEYTNIPGFVYVNNTITAVKPNTNDPKKVKLDVPIGDLAVGSEVVVSWEFTVRNLGRDTMTSANGVNISHKSNVTYDAFQNSSEILTFNVAGINLIVIGTVTDIIPKDFALSDKSKADINADVNTKFTENLDGTTTIVRENVRIDIVQKVTDVPFVIKRKDNSYGARFSNDEAWFDFRLADVPDMSKGFFEVPSIFVNPKTTNDEFLNNDINTDYLFDIKVNDAFSSGTKFTDNGYAVSDYSITITDSAGNPKTYTNAVDRFNASLDTTTKKLKFNTANEGAYALYYIVKATATKGTETKQLVSRPTLVTIKTKTTPNTAAVILTKRVTENSAEINSGDSFILKLAKTDNTLKSDVVLISNVGENSKTVMLAPGEYTITEIDAMNYDLVDISGNKGAFNSATKTYTFSVVKGDVVNIVINNAKTSSDGITAGINNNLAT